MIPLSSSNDKIKQIRKLSRRAARDKSGRFILEGRRAVGDAIAHGAALDFVLYPEGTKALFPGNIPQFSTDGKTFASLTDTESPQDVLAVAESRTVTIREVLLSAPRVIVFCDAVQDPGNLGTIVRTADAVGSAAVMLSAGCVDLFNPKVVRATMSSIFNVPVVKDAPTAVLPALKQAGYRVVCGALDDGAADLFAADLSQKAVIIIGNEGAGVSAEVKSQADTLVKIPMHGKAESLNAAVSAGILLYEHYRQNAK